MSRTINAAGWNFLNTGATFVLRLASNLIMTRLLVPEHFGILAFAMTFATAISLLTDLGITQSIIKEKDGLGPRFLRTAWTVKVLRSVVIALAVVVMGIAFSFIGPLIGKPDSVMAAPEMPLLIALTALSPLATGLMSTNWDLAMRRIQHKRIVTLEISTTVIRIIIQVIAGLISPTVWALFVGTLVAGYGKTIFSHLFLPGPRMRFVWDREIVAQLWSFGKWIMGSSTMTFVINNTDKLVFGAAMSGTLMGLYIIAFIWIDAGMKVIAIFARLLGLPVVSEILRENPDAARGPLRRYQMVVDAFCITSFLVLVLGGQFLATTLYTPEYHYAGTIIQLMAPLLLAVRYEQLANVIMATGDSRTQFFFSTIRGTAMVLFVLLGVWLGNFEIAITALVLAHFSGAPVVLMRSRHIFGRAQTVFDAGFGLVGVALTILVHVLVV